MDHEDEQKMEIEALQAILMDDLQEYEGKRPMGWPEDEGTVWRVVLSPSDDFKPEDEDDSEYLAELLFLHTARYPEELPLLRVRDIRGLREYQLSALNKLVNEVAEQSVGMPMIFQCVSDAKEWLRTKVEEDKPVDPEIAKKKLQEEEEQRRAAVRAAGTPVTPETFAAWRERFDTEMRIEKAKLVDLKALEEKAKRFTGRQWFDKGLHLAGARGKAGDEAAAVEAAADGADELDEEDFDFEDDGDEDFLDDYLAGGDEDADDEDFEPSDGDEEEDV